ncbi:MAG: hypothetical protein KVP17_003824 [Porospora cf. gigantea B]|uniref:uncharacterized protein n=1 Tax=Porospora cf. gigantea B TaxID=2853592 RepID=UPI0035717DA9|nr:MAG: hypothetical protein KVP17_003824 [Porospora cf. gigantea B]
MCKTGCSSTKSNNGNRVTSSLGIVTLMYFFLLTPCVHGNVAELQHSNIRVANCIENAVGRALFGEVTEVCTAINASNMESTVKQAICGETNQCHWDTTSTACVSGADSVPHDYTDEQKTAFCGAIASNDMEITFQENTCGLLEYCSWTPHGDHGHCDFVSVCDALNASNMESGLKEGVCGETNQCHWDATSSTCVIGAASVPYNYTDEVKAAFCGAVASNDMTMYFKGDACQALGYCSWTPHGDHGHCDFVSVCDALNASIIESALKEGVCGETNQCHWDATSTTCASGADSVRHNYTDDQKTAFCGAIASNDMTICMPGSWVLFVDSSRRSWSL